MSAGAPAPRPRDRGGVLWPYYGGKFRAARRYPIPRRVVVEPFAGAAGYSLWWTQAGFKFDVHLYDLDERVAALWRYLIAVPEREVLSLPDVPFGASVDDLPASVPPEAKLLIGWWMQPASSGLGKRKSTWARFGEDNADARIWGSRVRQRVAAQLRHVRHWRFYQEHYAASERHDAEVATYFVDPPYQAMGQHYRVGAKLLDFAALGAWCRARVGRVVACENRGANWLPFRPLARVQSAGRGVRATRSDEVVWDSARDQ